jgi:hypothetical protein
MQVVLGEAEEDVTKILEQARSAAQTMINILGGILGKDPKGKYFPLTNLSKVVGKNTLFIPGMSDVIQKFQFVIKVLEDIDDMESGR